MADFGKIKKNRFGDAPGEPSGNLKAPENAELSKRAKAERTEPLNFKVAPEFKKAFRQAALDEGLKLVELLEACFELCRKQENKKITKGRFRALCASWPMKPKTCRPDNSPAVYILLDIAGNVLPAPSDVPRNMPH